MGIHIVLCHLTLFGSLVVPATHPPHPLPQKTLLQSHIFD